MDIDGVRSINYVTITQEEDYNGGDSAQNLSNPTYHYSFDATVNQGAGGFITTGGTSGYGYKYNFESALVDGIILPPNPQNPGVFELKNPNQNIIGVVR